MLDTSGIHQLVRVARRRLRLQAALELATFALIPAAAMSLVVVYAVRLLWIAPSLGLALIGGAAALVTLAGLAGALRRLPTALVATRIDRASGLSDRLATACAFEESLARGNAFDPETEQLMRLAIADGARVAPRADVRAATPWRRPAELGPALAFVTVSAAIAVLLSLPGFPLAGPGSGVGDPAAELAKKNRLDERDIVALDEEDLSYTQDLLDELERTARETGDDHLQSFVDEVKDLLEQSERGELSKQDLLEKLAAAEKKYNEGTDQDVDATMKELEKTGKELEKEKLTRELGKALEAGDLETAQKELEKLAEKLDKEQLSDKEREKIAAAMKKAAEKFDKRESREEKQRSEKIEEAKKQLSRLKKQLEQAKSEREKSRLTRQLESKKRELKKLQREKEQREKSASRRELKQLHRDMKKGAEQMRQKSQQSRRQASKRMRDMARSAGKVSNDKRKMTNQRKVASQMRDLKDAMRRAKRRGSRGPQDRFGRNQRNQDFGRRARGGQGNRKSWKPGQNGQGSGKNGKKPGQNGGKGQQQGGKEHGDGTDPDLLGESTPKSGDIKDESLQGVHGKGPSTRETILTAAEKGFANRSYEKVYARYRTVVEEVINAEKVPAGYKYYVKKYFQKIKPQQ
jgi:hypothetical protein